MVASFALAALLDGPSPSAHQLVGAGLVVGAILVLSLAPRLRRDGSAAP